MIGEFGDYTETGKIITALSAINRIALMLRLLKK
jgi:hypothetical protein